MTAGPAFASLETALVAAARSAWERGWAPATSGNLSVRLPRGRFLVTGSGCDKGLLEREDLVVVGAEGRPEAAGRTPSAETALHLARYRSDDRIGAIVHVHALHAVVASRVWTDAVVLQGFELREGAPRRARPGVFRAGANLRQRPGHRRARRSGRGGAPA